MLQILWILIKWLSTVRTSIDSLLTWMFLVDVLRELFTCVIQLTTILTFSCVNWQCYLLLLCQGCIHWVHSLALLSPFLGFLVLLFSTLPLIIWPSGLLFRWFKFTLKPPYTVASGNLLSAISDTSHWTTVVKFGLKTAWDISYDILLPILKYVNFWRLQDHLSNLSKKDAFRKSIFSRWRSDKALMRLGGF